MENLFQHIDCTLLAQVLTCGLLAYLTTFLLIPLIIKMAFKLNLVDEPNNRKVHQNAIPTLGGIGIIIGFLFSTFAFIYQQVMVETFALLSAILALSTVGIIDDLKDVPAKYKLIFQLFLAVAMCYFGIRIESLGGLFGIYTLPLAIQYGLSVVIIAGFINAFNFIDGIDGLAGGIGAINALLMAILFMLGGEAVYAFYAMALFGGLMGFLYYNLSPAKIFMGDTGSTVIGFVLIVLGFKLMQIAPHQSNIVFSNVIILIFGSLLLPVFDIFRTIFFRIKSGNSPFQPDKTHIHHLLLQTRFNHRKTSIVLYIANVVLIGIAFLIKDALALEKSFIILIISCIFLTEMLSIKKWFNVKFDFNTIQKGQETLYSENQFIERNL